MTDRSSAPHRVPGRTSPEIEALIEQLRRLRWTSTRIAAELDLATSTVCAVLRRLGLHRLSRLEPPEPPNRYCRRHPGELIHVDIKKLGRFNQPGLPAHLRQAGYKSHSRRRVGWDVVHVAVDDTSRLAYIEILDDEKAVTCVAFLRRAIAWFATQGVIVQRVMTDNGPGYKSKIHAGRDRGAGDPAPPDPSLPAPHQRQSRTIHPDPPGRVGLRRQLPDQPTSSDRPRALARVLQLSTTTQRPRPQAARQPHQPG